MPAFAWHTGGISMKNYEEDFSPITPGEILNEEFLIPLGISQNRIARDIRVPPGRINGIVRGTRAITADTALRFSAYFGNTPLFWMNLQAYYDLEIARLTHEDAVRRDVLPFSVSRPTDGTDNHPIL